ncbi:substrate-binding periplasmic protein [Neptuniibacter sp. PT8_73]|uniref:substrate-binding periplasmic protein n=1 Tax=Neptuniibacter sp. PT8_73 TaxID=3398206 RepID=UPI0039F460EC
MRNLFKLCSLACLFIAPQISVADNIRLTTHQLPPYSYIQNNVITGTAVEVVKCAMNKIPNHSLEIIITPWKRAQSMVRHNTAEGFFAASHNHDRDRYAVMSEIIAEQKWTWYLLKNNTLDPSIDDFKQKSVVTSFLGANMQKWLLQNDFQTINNPPQDNKKLLFFLLSGRVDAILANNQVMNGLIQESGHQEKIRSVLNRNKPLGVYFAKQFIHDNPAFLPRFNKEVISCRK